jgi:hypothetical protein
MCRFGKRYSLWDGVSRKPDIIEFIHSGQFTKFSLQDQPGLPLQVSFYSSFSMPGPQWKIELFSNSIYITSDVASIRQILESMLRYERQQTSTTSNDYDEKIRNYSAAYTYFSIRPALLWDARHEWIPYFHSTVNLVVLNRHSLIQSDSTVDVLFIYTHLNFITPLLTLYKHSTCLTH